MPTAVIMPKFEMAQETGKVAEWLKAEGDAVRKGEPILLIETDKVNQEVEALADGILAGITARPGDVIPIGQTIAYILKPGEALPGASPTPSLPLLPSERGRAAVGAMGASPLAARLAESLGVDLAQVRGTGPRGQVTREDVEAYAAAHQAVAGAGNGKVRAVPAARRLARELDVDLRQVRGTGPEGRIQPEDVRAFAEASGIKDQESGVKDQGSEGGDHAPRTTEYAIRSTPSAPRTTPPIRRLAPLTNIRRTIAERMTASVREAPQFNIAVETDMTRALAMVEDLRGGEAKGSDGPRVTLTALLVKACAWALCQHPDANSAFQDGQIAEWDEVNVGVATAIDAGLIVPVIRTADQLGLRAIAARLADLTARARAGQLKLEDLQGGTFTLSNLGMFGIDQFTAILNPPQAAILAVGRVAKRAIVLPDDRIEVRLMTTLTLTADHRVLDGASAARFLATIQRTLEHPGLLLG